jgi:hypothetical protein
VYSNSRSAYAPGDPHGTYCNETAKTMHVLSVFQCPLWKHVGNLTFRNSVRRMLIHERRKIGNSFLAILQPFWFWHSSVASKNVFHKRFETSLSF